MPNALGSSGPASRQLHVGKQVFYDTLAPAIKIALSQAL